MNVNHNRIILKLVPVVLYNVQNNQTSNSSNSHFCKKKLGNGTESSLQTTQYDFKSNLFFKYLPTNFIFKLVNNQNDHILVVVDDVVVVERTLNDNSIYIEIVDTAVTGGEQLLKV